MSITRRAASHAASAGGFALRLTFFTLAPALILLFGLLAPVAPILVNLVVTVALLCFFEALRERVNKSRIAKRLLRRHILLIEYYRERQPRPFLYYLLFPLMAPYWLLVRDARREFNLYRRYVVANVVVLAALKYVEYRRHWAPEVSFGVFVSEAAMTFVIQLAFVLAVVVPTMVTIVDGVVKKQHKRLFVYGGAFTLVAALCGAVYARRPSGRMVPLPVCRRMKARTEADPERARDVRRAAILVADEHLASGKEVPRKHGQEHLGEPVDRARAALSSFYREDETECFRLFTVGKGDERVLVLRAAGRKKTGPIWSAKRAGVRTANIIEDVGELVGGRELLDEIDDK